MFWARNSGFGKADPSIGMHVAYWVFILQFMRLQEHFMHGILPAMSRTTASHLKQKRLRPCPEAVV